MQTTRTYTTQTPPYWLPEARRHARINFDDDDIMLRIYLNAAVLEIEAQTGLALVAQQVTVLTDGRHCTAVYLPVGPVAEDATATVEQIADDGTVTPVTEGVWFSPGNWPVLHIPEPSEITGRLRITYAAGFATVPEDIIHAIHDQALRYYEQRGTTDDKGPAVSPMCARVIARYKRVRA